NWRCAGDKDCKCLSNWCFKETSLDVTLPDPLWVFTQGGVRVDCTRDNGGSCGWNSPFETPDKFIITLNNPNHLRASVWTSSRSINIRLCAMARYYPPGP